ncbi:MAG: alpha/beta hydrolase, partial [Sediminibacterium sp.]
KQYECHVFTFAGFGGVPSIEDSWLPKIKEEVILYTRRLHLKDAVIIGHSLGGAMGLWLASTEPTLFKKLIVVDALPSTGALMIPNFKAENLQYNNPYSMQLLQMDSTKFRAQLKQQVSYMVLNKEKVEELVNTMAMSDRKTYVNGYTDLLKLDLREEIARISVPVIVLAATFPNKDAIEKNYNTQYEKLANKKIYFADNSAHFIMFDQPDWLLTKLKENIQ